MWLIVEHQKEPTTQMKKENVMIRKKKHKKSAKV